MTHLDIPVLQRNPIYTLKPWVPQNILRPSLQIAQPLTAIMI